MRAVITTLLMLCLFISSVQAGQSDTIKPIKPQEALGLARQVENYAAEHGARVFILARQGRPDADLPEGITFTHTAIGVYSAITLDNGETVNGYAIHNLYQERDNAGRSQIVVDYPVDFFWGAASDKAGLIIVNPTLESAIIDLIASRDYLALHNPRYSVIANPMNSTRQNCTEFTLDVINAAIYQSLDTARLKVNTAAYFTPQKINISKAKLLLGSMTSSGITLKDHQGKPATATFTSLLNYLNQYQLVDDAVLLENGAIASLL